MVKKVKLKEKRRLTMKKLYLTQAIQLKQKDFQMDLQSIHRSLLKLASKMRKNRISKIGKHNLIKER